MEKRLRLIHLIEGHIYYVKGYYGTEHEVSFTRNKEHALIFSEKVPDLGPSFCVEDVEEVYSAFVRIKGTPLYLADIKGADKHHNWTSYDKLIRTVKVVKGQEQKVLDHYGKDLGLEVELAFVHIS